MDYIQPYSSGSGMWILELSNVDMISEPCSTLSYPEHLSIEKQYYHFELFGLGKWTIRKIHRDYESVVKEYNLTEVDNLSDELIEKYLKGMV